MKTKTWGAIGVAVLAASALADPPVIEEIPDWTINEDTMLTVDVAVVDADSQQFLFWVEVDASGVRVSFDEENMQVHVTPLHNWNGVANVVVGADDMNGARNLDIEEFQVVVQPVNDCPTLITATPQPRQTPEDQCLSLSFDELSSLFNDVDWAFEGDTLHFLDPVYTAGTVEVGDTGWLLCTPLEYSGSGTLSYSATDGDCMLNGTLGIVVNSVNDCPVQGQAWPELAGVEDQPLLLPSLLAGWSDVEANSLEYCGVTGGMPGFTTDWDPATGALTIHPPADLDSIAQVLLCVSDGSCNVETSLTVRMYPVNDAPRLPAATTLQLQEDLVLQVPFAVVDVDGPALQVTVASSSPNLTATWLAESAELRLQPAPEWFGQALVTVTATDGFPGIPGTTTRQFPVTVAPVNDAPVVAPLNDVAFNEDSVLAVSVSASDLDSPALLISVSTDQPSLAAAWQEGLGRVLMTPAANWNGTAIVTVTVDDQNGAVVDVSFQAEVLPLNDGPQLSGPGSIEMMEDNTHLVGFAAVDVDGPSLTVTVSSSSPNLTAVHLAETQQLRLQSAADWFGQAVLTVRACDSFPENEACVERMVLVTVLAVNDAPLIAPLADASLPEDGELLVPVSIQDPDSPAFVIGLDTDRAELAIEWLVEEQAIRMVPQADWFGQALVTISADDQEGRLLSQQDFLVTVLPVNDAPYVEPCGDWLCGTVDDPEAFRTLLLEGGVRVNLADVDQQDLHLTWFANGVPVAEHVIEAFADTLECMSLPAPPQEWLEGQVVLHVELSDGEAVLNPGGEGCTWALDYTSLGSAAPLTFTFGPGYPNPFNPAVRLPFSLVEPGIARLSIYDIRGALVARLLDGWQAAGPHEIVWQPSGQASGIYLAVLEAEGRQLVERLTLLK